MNTRRWLREPLIHFLLAGAAIYAGVSWLSPAPDAGRAILIDDDMLVASLQQRTGSDAGTVSQALAVMSADDRAELVHEAAAQEALYREGRALGLDTVDSVVRLRTVQQMRLLLAEEATAGMTVSDAEIRDYYKRNKAAYAEPATASFSHLFYAGASGEARARAALAKLREGTMDASETGDRFLYQSNYSDTGTEELAAQFGIGFVEALLQLKPGERWEGPLKSDHGWHLVLLREKEEARVPPLAAIEGRVREDALTAKRASAVERSVDELLKRYDVRIR